MHGQLTPAGDRWRLRFVRRLAHSPDTVWRALTEPERLAAWFPTTIEGDRTEGAVLTFRFRGGEGPTLPGRIMVYLPPARFEFSWGDDVLRFELVPDGDGCVLTFLDTFDERGRAARDAAGWHVCLDALAADLAGAPDEPSTWAEVHSWYVTHFGPEAATIGPPARG